MQKVKLEPAGALLDVETQNCADTAKTLAQLGFTLTAVQGREFLWARVFVENNQVRAGQGVTDSIGEIFYPTETCVLVGRTEIDKVEFINDTAGSVGKLSLQLAYE